VADDIIGSFLNTLDKDDQKGGAGADSAEREKIGQNINNSSLYGIGAPPIKPVLEPTERARLQNKTKIIAQVWYKEKKKYEPDVKGKTTVFKRKTKEVKEEKEKEDDKGKGKGKGLLALLLGGLGLLFTGKFTLKGLLLLLVKGIWGLLKLIVKGIWGALKLAFKGLGSLFSTMFKGLKNSKIWKNLTKGLTAGKDAIKNIFLSVKGKIGTAVGAIGGFFRTIFSKIPGISKLFPSLAAGAGVKAGIKGSTAAAKAAEAAAKKKAAGGVTKVASKGIFKSILKKIPIVGAIAGIGFGIARAMKGDFAGAAAEVASGAASTIPGIGTAASVGIDAALIARDVSRAKKAGQINDGYMNKDGKITRIDDKDQALLFAEKGPLSNLFQMPRKGLSKEAMADWNKGAFNTALRNIGQAMNAFTKCIHTVARGLFAITGKIKTSNRYLHNLVHGRRPVDKRQASSTIAVTGRPGTRDPISQVVHNTNIGGKVAKLHLLQQKLSNRHLQRLVELTSELVKNGTGGTPAIIPTTAGPLPQNNDIGGDMNGPEYTDSRADFYASAYSMHTPGLPA
tara:strand:+ start:7149 stop:8846 length:1698 start_codon:yes stop_codon:yes gene_type:complete